MYDHYLPVVLTALAVLVLACWNPKALQVHRDHMPTGHPNYMIVALIALLVGLASCYFMHEGGHKMRYSVRGE